MTKLKTKSGIVYQFVEIKEYGADGFRLEMRIVSKDNRLVTRSVIYPTWEKLLERLNTLEEVE